MKLQKRILRYLLRLSRACARSDGKERASEIEKEGRDSSESGSDDEEEATNKPSRSELGILERDKGGQQASPVSTTASSSTVPQILRRENKAKEPHSGSTSSASSEETDESFEFHHLKKVNSMAHDLFSIFPLSMSFIWSSLSQC